MEQVMEFLKNLLLEHGLLLPISLYFVADWIKKSQLIAKNFIPPVLGILGMILGPFLFGGYTAENILNGLVMAGIAVYYYEAAPKALGGKGYE